MDIYCLPEFKKGYEKLCKNNSYSDLTQGIIDCFLGKKASDCVVGRNLNQSTIAPYLKRDLSGRSGFRLYYVVLLKKEEIYLGFVHQKQVQLAPKILPPYLEVNWLRKYWMQYGRKKF
jgi:hypothetical protein